MKCGCTSTRTMGPVFTVTPGPTANITLRRAWRHVSVRPKLRHTRWYHPLSLRFLTKLLIVVYIIEHMYCYCTVLCCSWKNYHLTSKDHALQGRKKCVVTILVTDHLDKTQWPRHFLLLYKVRQWSPPHIYISTISASCWSPWERLESTRGTAWESSDWQVRTWRLAPWARSPTSTAGIYNERPLYSSTSSSSGEEYLFYLVTNNKGLWMVGPEPGQVIGGLAHRWDRTCAMWSEIFHFESNNWNLLIVNILDL